MKFFGSISTLAVTLLLSGQALAGQYKGFSLGANRADGACKYEADWKKDFQTIKSWNKGFNAVRLYASSDCNSKSQSCRSKDYLLIDCYQHSSRLSPPPRLLA